MEPLSYSTPRPNAQITHTGADQTASPNRRMILEMLVISQLVQDLMVEFQNLPEIKTRFRYETSQVNGIFNQVRKRVKRHFPYKVFIDFETDVCNIVDKNDENIRWVRSMITTNMVNKISYDMVEPAVLIGMIGGLVDIMRFISKSISGKNNSDFDRIYDYLKYVDKHLDFTPLNEGSIDFASCNEAMTKMFVNIGNTVDEFLTRGYTN